MFNNLLKLLTRKAKTNQIPSGLHLAATKNAVVIYNSGAIISISPETAEKLAEALPRFAELSRRKFTDPRLL